MLRKAHKIRIYPNQKQKTELNKAFGCSRFVYNKCLEMQQKVYKEEKRSIKKFDMQKFVTHDLKKQYEWLNEPSAQSLQAAVINLYDGALKNFFKKQSGYPKFKNRHSKQSFSNSQGTKVHLKKKLLEIIKFRDENAIKCIPPKSAKKIKHFKSGRIKTMTLSKDPSGKYFASILVEHDGDYPEKKPITANTVLGIDVGLEYFVTTSTGIKVEAPRSLIHQEKKLKTLQKALARKEKGSANREKNRLQIAKTWEKITNIRKDFLHKLTHELVYKTKATAICVEDLHVKGMLKNPHLAKHISEASFSEFFRQLEYKCQEKGITFIKIDRFAPSSQLCHKCGYRNKELKLTEREWLCPECGAHHDRDYNAAQNIKAFGIKMLEEAKKEK